MTIPKIEINVTHKIVRILLNNDTVISDIKAYYKNGKHNTFHVTYVDDFDSVVEIIIPMSSIAYMTLEKIEHKPKIPPRYSLFSHQDENAQLVKVGTNFYALMTHLADTDDLTNEVYSVRDNHTDRVFKMDFTDTYNREVIFKNLIDFFSPPPIIQSTDSITDHRILFMRELTELSKKYNLWIDKSNYDVFATYLRNIESPEYRYDLGTGVLSKDINNIRIKKVTEC